MKKWVVKDLSERVRKLCSMQALLCRELSHMRLLCRDPPRTGIAKHFSASHWRSGKNGSSLTLNSFQVRKKVKNAVGGRLRVIMRLWIWKTRAGLKGSELGALQYLDTEPLKSYSCLKLDFHCCSYIHLNCCCFWFALRLMRSKSSLEQLFFSSGLSHKNPETNIKHFSLLLYLQQEFSLCFCSIAYKKDCPCPYSAPPNTGTPHPRRDSVLPPFSLGSQPHIPALCHCGLFRCLSTCLPMDSEKTGWKM